MVEVKKFSRCDYQTADQLERDVSNYLSSRKNIMYEHVIEKHYRNGRLVKVFLLINYKKNIGRNDE